FYALRLSKIVQANKAYIMAVIGINPPWITQAYN
ncbi:unnamed protein product, partial [marine sediment metagenome]